MMAWFSSLPPWAWWLAGLLTPVAGNWVRRRYDGVAGTYRKWLRGLPPYQWYGLWQLMRGWDKLVQSKHPGIEVRSFDGRRWISVDVQGFRDPRDETP